jgi:hypothetical protein
MNEYQKELNLTGLGDMCIHQGSYMLMELMSKQNRKKKENLKYFTLSLEDVKEKKILILKWETKNE